MNAIYKGMYRLAMSKLLNTEIFQYDPIVFRFMQDHKNYENQYVSVSKENTYVLSFICTKYAKKYKQQVKSKFSNH